jgi:hypothetical protein
MYPHALSEILVFKTNILHTGDERKLAFLSSVPGVKTWNIDLQDVDHVLRVETEDVSPSEIVQAMNDAGFVCEELPD